MIHLELTEQEVQRILDALRARASEYFALTKMIEDARKLTLEAALKKGQDAPTT